MSLLRSRKTAMVVLLLAALAAALLYVNRPESAARSQTTDNAYVRADFTLVAPQVAGRLEQVLIEDGQEVVAGQLLATIDARDFVIAVDDAQARVQGAQASIARLKAQIARQDSEIVQAAAAVKAARAALTLAEADRVRYRNLAADGSGTRQALQQAQADAIARSAGLEQAQAAHTAALHQRDILLAEQQQARAALAQRRAQRDAARQNLAYTRIVAPVAGTIGRRSLREGAYVTVGQPLTAIVPLQQVYIVANYRETQLAHVRPGQPVEIEVDALPGVTLNGEVDSLAPASTASYEPLGPLNASGNFTKVVQRLPVRIRLLPGQPEAERLRVGMSVRPRIDSHASSQASVSLADGPSL
ncbi:HlyD family secretion protein [Bordetella trematum]|uniref:HlyD family secretion protein n=1 Tax=Bordetella trematum TaxID=123899 RepID=UPI0013FD5A61|nr:HlyD family secretion protein [Bordetella trematum]